MYGRLLLLTLKHIWKLKTEEMWRKENNYQKAEKLEKDDEFTETKGEMEGVIETRPVAFSHHAWCLC